MANNNGTNEGIIAAKIQCTLIPKDWPELRKWFGKISEIYTHIMAPWPMACDAIKTNKNYGIRIPSHLKKKAHATKLKEIIYPKDP